MGQGLITDEKQFISEMQQYKKSDYQNEMNSTLIIKKGNSDPIN